jgi:hypothetical protein
MLRQAIHSFEFPSSITDAVRSDLIAYEGLLKSKGYIARKWCVAYEDMSKPIITISAIACWPDCLSRALRDPQIANVLSVIRSNHGASDAMRYGFSPGTIDEHYANDPPWARLRLEPDCIFGTSPLKTPEKGIVATFVPTLDDDLAAALWTWDVEYDHIFGCWLASGSYEQWAERELSDPGSPLNKTGLELASRLSRAIGCPVDYSCHEQER